MTSLKQAVIYCRVSTKEQVEEGNSLVTQERLCREYALRHGYEIIEKFIEQGESAKTANRPELQRLLKYCSSGKKNISAVIAYKIDRISRNTDDYSQIRIILKRLGVEIKSTTEHFESSTPAGKFMENMIANVAQFDNDVRIERCIGGMRDAVKEDGRYVWQAPAGYKNIRINGKATIAPDESAPFIRKAFEEVALSMRPIEEIRRDLVRQGLRSKKGRKFCKSQFYRILKNELYSGWITKFGIRRKGTYEALISDDLFALVQYKLRGKARHNLYYLHEREDFPLRRFITHPDGTKLTGCWSKGRSKSYPYYLFHKGKGRFTKEQLESAFISFLNTRRLHPDHVPALKEHIQSNYKKAIKSIQTDKQHRQKELDKFRDQETQIIKKNIDGLIPDSTMRQQLALLENEKAKAVEALLKFSNTDDDLNTLLQETEKLIEQPGQAWKEMPFPVNLALQRFYFPEGIVLDTKKSRTTDLASSFKAKTTFWGQLSPIVNSVLSISNTPEVENTIAAQGSNNPQGYITSDNFENISRFNELGKCLEGLVKIKDDADKVRRGEPLQDKPASSFGARKGH